MLSREVFAAVSYAEGEVAVDGPQGTTGAVVTDCGGMLPAAVRQMPEGDFFTAKQVPDALGSATVMLYGLDKKGKLLHPELREMKEIQKLPVVQQDHAVSLDYFSPGRYELALRTAEDFEKLLRRIENVKGITPAPPTPTSSPTTDSTGSPTA